VASFTFVFDSSPLVASCQFTVGRRTVAEFEARLAELYQQWQALRISTSRFAELLGVSPWELADLLRARGLKITNLPG
jgi:predicted HTH domain antitoxin